MTERIDRAILKLSGEVFGDKENPIKFANYESVAKKILEIVGETKIELAVVIGGGNIFRGREAESQVDNTEADAMGMLSTVINGIGLREALVRNGAKDTRLMTAFDLRAFAEPYIRLKARHHLDEKRLVIIAGGLGLPNFSTDSAVAQYADELRCDIIFKASTVDGVYDSDPRHNSHAVRYKDVTYKEAIEKELGIMDTTAFAMCKRSGVPIFVFNISDLEKLPQIIKGDHSFGTLIHQ
jgi:uridylate kinase